MERNFEVIPNFVDTLLVYNIPANRRAFKKLEYPFNELYKFDENGECEIEFEFYDGLAIATDGSGLFMTYPKMEEIKASPRKQASICDYNGIYDSIYQRDICLRYGKLDCDPNNEAYVKTTGSNAYKLAETFILLSADMYEKIYNMSDVEGYDVAVKLVHDAAIRFERELNWQGVSEERDYILELEKFEERELARLRSIYDTDNDESEFLDRKGNHIVVGSKVIWYDPEVAARDLTRVYDVDDLEGDIVYISDDFSEAEVLPQELEVVG